MSFAKSLCVLCERPTADGAVQAVHVDKEKLHIWLLNVCGHEFAEKIEDPELICYFCMWHAEFLAKKGLDFEADSWWPQDLYYLDDAAKELRKSYFDGKVEQCWVQLEKMNESESEEEIEIETVPKSGTEPKMKSKCFYCKKFFKFSGNLAKHVRNAHKHAIRCENRKCATYFHTVEEKTEHVKNFHETSKERKIIQCCFCEKKFLHNSSVHEHVRRVHSEFPVKCTLYGCLLYFKSDDEMKSHFESTHKEKDEAKKHECNYCGYRAKQKRHLERHIAAKHLPKKIKCEKCDRWFSSMKLLKIHDQRDHSYKICSICEEEVTSQKFSLHLKKQKCQRCKSNFDCSGLYQMHWETCKETQFKCEKCAKMFQKLYLLKYHVRSSHRNNSWRGSQHKNLGFKCRPCKSYFKRAVTLKNHLKYKHSAANLKQCAHCPKSFSCLTSLNHHLATKHNLIEISQFECDFCKKKFVWKGDLSKHIQSSHLNRARGKCLLCGREMLMQSMEKHLLCVHDKY